MAPALILQAVIATPIVTSEFTSPWPMAPANTSDWIKLSGEMTNPEIGLALSLLLEHNQLDSSHSVSEVLEQLLVAAELIWMGGIRAVGSDGRNIPPSCCCGLETWREWPDFLATGTTPWLGHSPSPWVENYGDAIRIWSDGGLGESVKNAFFVDVSRAVFKESLSLVERDLQAFLFCVESWAQEVGCDQSAELVQKIDRCFDIRRKPTIYE
jgi:hypothetical protein